MLLNTLQCQDSPHNKNFLSPNVNGADLLRNSDLKWQASTVWPWGLLPEKDINGLHTREPMMEAQRCFWLLLGIPIRKTAHNRAILLRQINNNNNNHNNNNDNKNPFWFGLTWPQYWLNFSPPPSSNDLAVSVAQTHQKITTLCSRVGYFLFFQCPHLERFVINIFCIHIFLLLSNDLGPKNTARVFCFMYHSSEAIFRHFLVVFHFKNFPNICYISFFLHRILV